MNNNKVQRVAAQGRTICKSEFGQGVEGKG